MNFYAHTLEAQPKEHWEPLFTPFGDSETQCQRDTCKKCERMDAQHGHLNKVAYHTAKFAAEMFPQDSHESKTAHQWGYLTGLLNQMHNGDGSRPTRKSRPATSMQTGKLKFQSASLPRRSECRPAQPEKSNRQLLVSNTQRISKDSLQNF